MRAISHMVGRISSVFAAAALLLAASNSLADTVNLTAGPTSTVLPDGQTVPMWGYTCGATVSGSTATCAATNPAVTSAGNVNLGKWSPVVITVPAGTGLTINLTNNLNFATPSGGSNGVPTSLTMVGQLGGGLGKNATFRDSPVHPPQGLTWPGASMSIGAVTLVSGGSGYVNPTVAFVGGGGSGAEAVATVDGTGKVTAINITNVGTGYTGIPTVQITGQGNTGSGASASVSLSASDPNGDATFVPPAQPQRVQSFGTEVAAGATTALSWDHLRPGTYLIESGTHPSIQGPMGLYGVLVVTSPATYPGVAYDAEAPLVLSEIDPVQNGTVAAAVATDGFLETAPWSGQPGQCGDPGTAGHVNPTYLTCYPPAVNYAPLYYLINGVSFDRTNIAASLVPAQPSPAGSPLSLKSGNLLLRFVNAGLRMHVPAVVNNTLQLVAEDGNVLPGLPRKQTEVFLAAGKTYDAILNVASPASGSYVGTSIPVYDRQLSLSTNNQRDGGMQAYVTLAGGAAGGAVGSVAASGVNLSASDKTFYCAMGQTLSVSDPSRGLLGSSVGANGVTLSSTALPGTLVLQSDGTFTYQSPATGACGGSFAYKVNGTATHTATITECDASSHADSKCGYNLATNITLGADSYTSNVATRLHISPPGVLANDADSLGLPLNVDPASVHLAAGNPGALVLSVNPDGSFTAVAPTPGTYSFTYNVKNSQGTAAASAATVSVVFPQPSNLAVNIFDVIDGKNGARITDYRWIIEEDRTFIVDPNCQINSNDPALRPASCPPLPVQSIGYNFHTANMPVVATGCTGAVSCESGQTVLGAPAHCDSGNGVCVAETDPSKAEKAPLNPSTVHLDPAKHYYLTVMPADGINPTLNGQGAPIDLGNGQQRAFATQGGSNNLGDCTGFVPGVDNCGHNMGGAQISGHAVALGQTQVDIALQRTPLPTSQLTVMVYEDDYPLNGENDAGGGVDVLAPQEPGLGGFNIVLFDQAGGLGDNTGQPTYDMFNQPLSNALSGQMDPITGANACPITARPDGLVGVIPVCPTYESDGKTLSPLAGQAVIRNLYPGLYEIQAYPAADRIGKGEEWLQTNTLDGGKPHEAFIKPNEPAAFQEFGPGNFHVMIGFANPALINGRKNNAAGTGLCDPASSGGGGLDCKTSLYGVITNAHMSRTPDQRIYSSGDYSHYGFTQCYIGIGIPDGEEFAFAKCDPDGKFQFDNLPTGTYKLTVFDQWNDIMLDGLVQPVTIGSEGTSDANRKEFPVTQWRTNLYTRTFLDTDGNGTSTLDTSGVPCTGTATPPNCNANYGNATEPGLPLVATNIRYRDGSFGFYNNTDLNGYAGFNEVFPFMNWLVVEADSTRYKSTGIHVVNDTGGPPDGTDATWPSSFIASGLANTREVNSLPKELRVPGAVYCTNADCIGASIAAGPYWTNNPAADTGPTSGLSSGRVDPPQWFGPSVAWQGLLGQDTFMEFGVKPYKEGENGGIKGHVIYASTRPFDDPALLLQLQWEPGVPHVTINLYKEGLAADGTQTLTKVDTTQTTSFDDWAQGFRRDANGNLLTKSSQYTDASGQLLNHTGYIPNMNCPGQDPTSPFFETLNDSTEWLDSASAAEVVATPSAVSGNASTGYKHKMALRAQFKCFDGWSMLNQAQPAPYDGKYQFPSVTQVDSSTGRPAKTNCTACVVNPDDGLPMLPAGRYVVEVIVPPGFELVKEEDKNILLGDIYIAPITQQFPGGVGNIFIMPDQASVNAAYNRNNPLNSTNDLGSSVAQRHEGDTGSIEAYWPCVGAMRVVPDFNSLYPGAQQTAPFAGATRPLCDRKEVILEDQQSVLAKFYVFTPAHIAGHFTGVMSNDFASEFDPFSPQFGEKFGPPNLPVGMRDFAGHEMGRVYSDQWGVYNGLYYSSWEVNPPNPTGYAPQMAIACMNDPGPIARTNLDGLYIKRTQSADGTVVTDTVVPTADQADQITDPNYNPAYSNFCYEMPYMPGFTAYMDTPVVPVMAFADGYNLPDAEYPDGTPAIASVVSNAVAGPWVPATGGVSSILLTSSGSGYTAVSNVTLSGGGGSGAAATARMGVGAVNVTAAGSNYSTNTRMTFANCTGNGCTRATGTVTVSGGKITGIAITNPGSGYTTAPAVTLSQAGSGSGAKFSVTLGVVSVAVGSAGSGYTSAPSVSFSGVGSGAAATAATTSNAPAAGSTLTITALGDRQVQNPEFSGVITADAPFNQKTITRHYDFGSDGGTVALVGRDGVAHALTVTSWTKNSIQGTMPTSMATCGHAQQGYGDALCGELVITKANGQTSIDTVTVTAGGKPPKAWVAGQTIQQAIDDADPGDLILVPPGTYREQVIMWKPVRLQGTGAASTVIDADAHPSGKLDPWRRQVACLFGLHMNGVPATEDKLSDQFDPAGVYSCPDAQYMKVDRIPFEAVIGWDTAGNGNLAQLLQEPTLMGAYEGAGITVVGRGVRAPAGNNDFWGINATGGAGAFTDGSVWLGNTANDCKRGPSDAQFPNETDYGTSNYYCNPSRIDGLSVINSSQGGGGIFVHGWAHYLEIANNRISANAGTLAGGINLGNGETPDAFINDNIECGVSPVVMPCPPIPAGTATNAAIPFQFSVGAHVHHNMIIDNASVGDALFSGTPSGSGGITVSAGADRYVIDHNWIAGNLSTGDGGGIGHLGLSFNGNISNNWILFNQSTNPTLPTNGGGLVVLGANQDQLIAGVECGSLNDVDCPPGIGEGTGPGMVIDSNLILGNSAESGSGGGLRLQQVNGTEVGTFPLQNARWYDVTVTNNVIANNVAGWDGAGISIEDTLRATITNNTVVSNDTTASAGVLFKTLGAIDASSPPPHCVTDPTLPQNPACTNPNAAHNPQPAGLVVETHTPNLLASIRSAGTLGLLACPSVYGGTSCNRLSVPALTNNIIYGNRDFHVELIKVAGQAVSGTGLQSQQNLIALVPALNQNVTGACMTSGFDQTGATTPVSYWDVGVRGDVSINDGKGYTSIYGGNTGVVIPMTNSIYTSIAGVTYPGSNNIQATASPVIAQYCNGSRVPPENGGHGYQAPPGRSETTGLSTVFVFNNIAPAATVDEGNNWINLTYGPLTLASAEQSQFTTHNNSMVLTGVNGPALGSYSIAPGSPAINRGLNSAAPAHDFFGNTRVAGGTVDIGAVEYQTPASAVVVLTPSSGAYGQVLHGATKQIQFTISNVGGAAFTGGTVALSTTGGNSASNGSFVRATGGCATPTFTLAVNASCTVTVTFTASTTAGTVTNGSLAVTGSVAVVNSPVALSGTSAPSTYTVSVGPDPLDFGTWANGTTSNARDIHVVNTGNTALAQLTYNLSAGARFTRVTTGTFPTGQPSCGTTLAVGATCTLRYTFAPNAVANFSSSLTVASTTAGTLTPLNVTLTGVGVAARATVSTTPNPLTITLPSGILNLTGTGTVTLTNTAPANGAQMVVSAVNVAGGTALTYFFNAVAGSDTCTGALLAPGQSCTVGVRFTNVASARGANRAGTLTFTDNGGATGSQVVNLVGFATP